MNLADSIKFVLKKRSQKIFSLLIKEDLKNTVKDVPTNIMAFSRMSNRAIRRFSLKESMGEVKSSLYGTALLVKIIPRRVNAGFKHFGMEFMTELEKLPDPKERTVFCMKILAGLSKFALSSAYDVGLGDIKFLGMGKGRVLYSRVIVSKLMFKTLQAIIIRFIDEIEKEIEGEDDIKQLEALKKIILDDSGNAIDKFFEGVTDPDDRAFAIVENFKNYILTGEQA
jgi:hypothetical protein